MNIIVLDGDGLTTNNNDWDILKDIGDIVIYGNTKEEEIIKRSIEADILLVHKTRISSEVLKNLPRLKYIGVFATGYNVIDIDGARKQGVIVTNVPEYSTNSVAQFVFALIFHYYFQINEYSNKVRNNEWNNIKNNLLESNSLIELASKRIGIIGYGNIGRKVADISKAFGMDVIVYSRRKKDNIDGITWADDLDELLIKSDIVTIHCPLFEETRNLINKTNLIKMKKTALLINTSRGPIINEEDLAYALNNNIIQGAVLDVLSKEPPLSDNPLLTAKNCIITPHIAWATKEARSRVISIVADNIKSFLEGRPKNQVI